MCKRILILSSVAAIIFAGASGLLAQADPAAAPPRAPSERQPATAPQQPNQQGQAYLGVAYVPVPKAVVSQLSTNFPEIGRGSGVLITGISPDSPAAKAGVKPYDIVISFDNQSVGSPDQFMAMVGRDAPGREVMLKIVRAAKSEDVKVTLGARPGGGVVRGQSPSGEAPQGGPEMAGAENVGWESFDSLSLTRTDKDHFKAEISYRDDQGKTQSRSFQGTRDQLRQDIMAQRDLPNSERHQLLGALHLPMEMWNSPGSDAPDRPGR